jgi:WD40 repeat protein
MKREDAIGLIEQRLERGKLTTVQEAVFNGTWEGKTYAQIATQSGYDHGHIKDVGSDLWRLLSSILGEKVTKNNLYGILLRTAQSQLPPPSPLASVTIDWGDAIDVGIFYGRTQELSTLQTWIVQDRCRLITLIGMGGMGKTFLSIKVAEAIQTDFESLIWRSLRDAPPIDELLTSLIQSLSPQPIVRLPESPSAKLSCLLDRLRTSRCLIILDNFDTLFQTNERTGTYREGYELYGEFLRRIGEISHPSCLILTSREKPQETAALEGIHYPVRSLNLTGLQDNEAEQILVAKGLTGPTLDRRQFVRLYGGNPLALKIAATSVLDLFEGEITPFLDQGSSVFNGIHKLLEQQIKRLSELELKIMFWLSINREATTTTELLSDLVPSTPIGKVLEALESLTWRSLVEKSKANLNQKNEVFFTQQPVIMEYLIDQFIYKIQQELITGDINWFNQYALIKAQSKDYIRESQTQLILKPISNYLKIQFNHIVDIEKLCQRILITFRKVHQDIPGYTAGNIINLLRYLKVDLTGYDFSRLTIRQAYLQGIQLPQVDFSQSNLATSRFTTALSNTLWVEFSKDGKLLITSDCNGRVRLWSVPDGQELQSIAAHSAWAFAVRSTPDGKMLVTCGGGQTIKLWDVVTGHCLKILEGHTAVIWIVSLSPDGRYLASSGMDPVVKVWDIQTGNCIQNLTGTGRAIAFHPDGNLFAFVELDRTTIVIWDIHQERIVSKFIGHTQTIWSMHFSHDGQTLVSGGEDRSVRFWNLETEESHLLFEDHPGGWIWSIAVSPDDHTLAVGDESGTITVWDIQTKNCLKVLKGHTGHFWSIAFSPDGNFLATSSAEDQAIRLWQVDRGYCLKELQGYSSRVWSVSTSRNSTNPLLISALNQQIGLWNLTTGDCVNILSGHTSEVYAVALCDDRSLLASGSVDCTIKIWNCDSGKCLQTFQGHQGWIFSVAFHPHHQILASASVDTTIRIWDIQTGDILHTLEGQDGWMFSVAFSPDGNYLASGSQSEIKIWDTTTWKCVNVFKGHQAWIWSVAFNADGSTLVSGSFDHTVKLWDFLTGTCLQTLQGHTQPVLHAIYTSGEEIIASCSHDQTVKFWDVHTGQCLKTCEGHTAWISQLALHPNEQILISGSQDESIKLWDLETGQCLETWVAPRPYAGMNIMGVTGLTEAQKVSLKMMGASENPEYSIGSVD